MLDKTPTAPTTTDEQIAFLRSRGLCIPDEEHAKSFLLRNNYYRIKGYTLTLCRDGVFNEDASFQDVEDIYSFDLELRHLLLKYLEIIETTIKSVYAYEFAHIYGPVGYLDSNNFLDANEYNTIMKKAKKQRDSRIAHEAYPVHFENDWTRYSCMGFCRSSDNLGHIFLVQNITAANQVHSRRIHELKGHKAAHFLKSLCTA